jgi:tRNA-(MS[2]IO[6]A)-hydroxylase MiaE-like protein
VTFEELEPAGRDQAVAEVVGAVAYALLRVFQISAQVTLVAPNLALRERQAAFAVEEFERYRIVRRRLSVMTEDPETALARFSPTLDAFYDAAPIDAWLDAQVFHYVGDAITTDFAGIIAAHLDERTAAALREALTGRGAHESFALAEIQRALASDPSLEERVAAAAGRVVGEAMNRVRDTILVSDTLALVLGGEGEVKGLILELLARHRERLERLGLDQLD